MRENGSCVTRQSTRASITRCVTSFLKAVPGLLLLAAFLYGVYLLDTGRRPRGVLETTVSEFVLGFGIFLVAAAAASVAWGAFQLFREAEREGWLGRLLAVPIVYGALACLSYSSSVWWLAGPGRLPILALFFGAGMVVGSFLKRRTP